jgi:aqualysin 1
MAIRQARLLILLAVLAVVAANSPPAAAESRDERYIVVFDDSVADADVAAALQASELGGEVSSVFHHALKGYAGAFRDKRAVERLSRDRRVRLVERDRKLRADVKLPAGTGALWDLDRIDQHDLPLDGRYSYVNTGAGVTAYVIDTGIRYDHAEFGGRADLGIDTTSRSGDGSDCDGHGTHVAAILGGATYGVAREVTLKSVRVLDCHGEGYTSDIIRGIDWVTADHQAGQPAVANLSLGGGKSSSLDAAIRRSIADGVSYAVSAGNDDRDACRFSPARVREAMTTGATRESDRRASWSNYGSCIDWFAPGAGILSAGIASRTATETWSGTSMASPQTAGVAALYLQSHPSASPAAVQTALYDVSTKDVVSRSKSNHDHLLFTNF